ncbi:MULTISPECIES: DUF6999 family protein [unclassified Microcoleus]|uniref:DUF6999 family protein n=1 Tax=unclassified Microcoleus TaxID=2642155 RepID=UPI002FD66DFF
MRCSPSLFVAGVSKDLAYVSKITGNSDWNHVILNRHPLGPNSPFNTARDLFLHGIVSEYLYRYLELQKEMRNVSK